MVVSVQQKRFIVLKLTAPHYAEMWRRALFELQNNYMFYRSLEDNYMNSSSIQLIIAIALH